MTTEWLIKGYVKKTQRVKGGFLADALVYTVVTLNGGAARCLQAVEEACWQTWIQMVISVHVWALQCVCACLLKPLHIF